MPSSQSAKKSAVTATDQRYIVPGLERGLKLLQLFDRGRTVLGAAEVARALEVPRSSAFRLIQTLEYLGYLERTGNDYRLGPAVLRLGFEYVAALPITELARPILANLRDECGCTAQLALRDQREVVYVMHVLGPSHFSSNVSVGTRLPVHATALGRMFLAYMSDQAISALYAGSTLQRFSNRTTITVNGLIERAHADRARGCGDQRIAFRGGHLGHRRRGSGWSRSARGRPVHHPAAARAARDAPGRAPDRCRAQCSRRTVASTQLPCATAGRSNGWRSCGAEPCQRPQCARRYSYPSCLIRSLPWKPNHDRYPSRHPCGCRHWLERGH